MTCPLGPAVGVEQAHPRGDVVGAAEPAEREVRPEALPVDRGAGPGERRPASGGEPVELGGGRVVRLEPGVEDARPVGVRERTAARDAQGEGPPPAGRPAQALVQVVEAALGHLRREGDRQVPLVGHGPAEARRPTAYGEEVVEVLDDLRRRHHRHEHPLRSRHYSPRSRPISIFMISLEPAQIFVTRASRQARATRYSFM